MNVTIVMCVVIIFFFHPIIPFSVVFVGNFVHMFVMRVKAKNSNCIYVPSIVSCIYTQNSVTIAEHWFEWRHKSNITIHSNSMVDFVVVDTVFGSLPSIS